MKQTKFEISPLFILLVLMLGILLIRPDNNKAELERAKNPYGGFVIP